MPGPPAMPGVPVRPGPTIGLGTPLPPRPGPIGPSAPPLARLDGPPPPPPLLWESRTETADPGPGRRTLADSHASDLVISTDAPISITPAEIAPQSVRPRTPRIVHSEPTRRLVAGDLICGQCGEGNPQARNFCSRCGASLTAAEVAQDRGWRRFLPRHAGKTRLAGSRPPGPGEAGNRDIFVTIQVAYRWISAVLGAVAMAMFVVYLIYSPLQRRVNEVASKPIVAGREWVHRQLEPPTQIYPVKIKVKVRGEAGTPGLATDGAFNTHWQVRWDKNDPPALTLTFDKKVDLEKIIIYAGTAGSPPKTHRPAVLHLIYSTDRTDTLTVADTAEAQTLDVHEGAGMTSVQIQITDIHRAPEATDVSISELEFFARE